MSLQPYYSPTGHFADSLVLFSGILWTYIFLHKAFTFLVGASGVTPGDGVTRPPSPREQAPRLGLCVCRTAPRQLSSGEDRLPHPSPSPAAGSRSFSSRVLFSSPSFSCSATSGCPWPAWSSSCSCVTCSTRCSVGSAGTRTTCTLSGTWRPGE